MKGMFGHLADGIGGRADALNLRQQYFMFFTEQA
jgi:hypothetical protein